MTNADSGSLANRSRSRESFRLCLLFGALAFIQGFADPTEGLPSQPVRALLGRWGRSAAEIATFSALLALPWTFKPLFGLLTDFVPLAGTRRRSYLVLASAATSLAFLVLWAMPLPVGAARTLLLWLTFATAAVACSDVVCDALMVERGQPLGLTGRLQAVQWASSYASGLIAGSLGGVLSEWSRQDAVYLLCGGCGIVAWLLVILSVREPRQVADPAGLRDAVATLWRAFRSPAILGVGGFLFLWNFNPFSTAVLHLHMTRAMGFTEQFYGHSLSLLSLAAIAACLSYGIYARRVSRRALIDLSIALGVASTLGYLAMSDQPTAMMITLAIGFTYMTATLIQLDIAAQACPPEAAGTVFASLMALSNLSMSLSTWLGGELYDRGAAQWGSTVSFRLLVVIGAAFTSCCWLLVPMLSRVLPKVSAARPPAGAEAADDLT